MLLMADSRANSMTVVARGLRERDETRILRFKRG
jgi:hypothetical protein